MSHLALRGTPGVHSRRGKGWKPARQDMRAMNGDLGTAAGGGAPKVLVVNDSPDFLAMMREVLTTEGGYEVATLDQSEGVVEQASAAPPDLIIIDIIFRGGHSGL